MKKWNQSRSEMYVLQIEGRCCVFPRGTTEFVNCQIWILNSSPYVKMHSLIFFFHFTKWFVTTVGHDVCLQNLVLWFLFIPLNQKILSWFKAIMLCSSLLMCLLVLSLLSCLPLLLSFSFPFLPLCRLPPCHLPPSLSSFLYVLLFSFFALECVTRSQN